LLKQSDDVLDAGAVPAASTINTLRALW